MFIDLFPFKTIVLCQSFYVIITQSVVMCIFPLKSRHHLNEISG